MPEPMLRPVLAQEILARYTHFLRAAVPGAELLHPAPTPVDDGAARCGAHIRNIYNITQYLTENRVANLQMNLQFAGRLLTDAVQAAGKARAAAAEMLGKSAFRPGESPAQAKASPAHGSARFSAQKKSLSAHTEPERTSPRVLPRAGDGIPAGKDGFAHGQSRAQGAFASPGLARAAGEPAPFAPAVSNASAPHPPASAVRTQAVPPEGPRQGRGPEPVRAGAPAAEWLWRANTLFRALGKEAPGALPASAFFPERERKSAGKNDQKPLPAYPAAERVPPRALPPEEPVRFAHPGSAKAFAEPALPGQKPENPAAFRAEKEEPSRPARAGLHYGQQAPAIQPEPLTAARRAPAPGRGREIAPDGPAREEGRARTAPGRILPPLLHGTPAFSSAAGQENGRNSTDGRPLPPAAPRRTPNLQGGLTGAALTHGAPALTHGPASEAFAMPRQAVSAAAAQLSGKERGPMPGYQKARAPEQEGKYAPTQTGATATPFAADGPLPLLFGRGLARAEQGTASSPALPKAGRANLLWPRAAAKPLPFSGTREFELSKQAPPLGQSTFFRPAHKSAALLWKDTPEPGLAAGQTHPAAAVFSVRVGAEEPGRSKAASAAARNETAGAQGESPAARVRHAAVPAGLVHRTAQAPEKTAPAAVRAPQEAHDIETVHNVTRRVLPGQRETMLSDGTKRAAAPVSAAVPPEMVEALTEKIYKSIEKRLKTEKTRRGM